MKELYKSLPNGAVKEIAKIANINIITMSKVINGKKVRQSSKIKVLKAIEQYLKQKQEQETQLQESIKQLLTQ
jgi:bacterial regulatory proteins, lacI family